MRSFLAFLTVGAVALLCSDATAQVVPQIRAASAPAARFAGDFNVSPELPPLDPALTSAADTGLRGVGLQTDPAVLKRFGTGTAVAGPFGPACPDLSCPGGAVQEGEDCGDINSGCSEGFCADGLFTMIDPVAAPVTICGSAWTDDMAMARDVDWYNFDVTCPTTISITLQSELPLFVALLEHTSGAMDCTGVLLTHASGNSDCGAPVTITDTLQAGSYSIFIGVDDGAPLFAGYPCLPGVPGNNNDYILGVTGTLADCLVCAPGAVHFDEAALEPCGMSVDDGCNDQTCLATGAGTNGLGTERCSLMAGLLGVGSLTTVCGTSRTFVSGGAFRDTDWIEFTLPPGNWDLTYTLEAEGPLTTFLIADISGAQVPPNPACTNLVLADGGGNSTGCNPFVRTVTLSGGTYTAFVSTGDEFGAYFTGLDCVACPTSVDYQLSLLMVPATCPTLCVLACVGTPEGEACGTDTNGGCNATPQAFQPMANPQTYCGSSFADITRDTDWYEIASTVGAAYSFDLTFRTNMSAAAPGGPGSGDVAGCAVFVLSEIAGQQGGPGDFGLGCSAIQFVEAWFFPGDCGATGGTDLFTGLPVANTVTVTLPFDPLGNPMRHTIFVGADDGSGGGAFAGVSCICLAEYELTVAPAVAPVVCTGPTIGGAANCATGAVDFILTQTADVDTMTVDVLDGDGMVVATNSSGPHMNGDVVNRTIGPLPNGIYTADITVTCGANTDVVQTAAFALFAYNGENDVIFDLEPNGGCNDSVAALDAALQANGQTTLVVPIRPSGWACLSDIAAGTTVWALYGTFPNNIPISDGVDDDGPALASLVNGNHPTGIHNTYVEAADGAGFDVDNEWRDWDGIDGRFGDGNVIPDGDDTHVSMNGVGAGPNAPDTTQFGSNVAYNQDNRNSKIFLGDDFTDQLQISGSGLGSGTDLPAGSIFSAVWNDDGLGGAIGPYATAVAKDPNDVLFGKVVSASSEFGGIDASIQNQVALAYLAFFDRASTDVEFRRGDCNNDGTINIADAVFALTNLFPGMNPPPGTPCADACDGNDDGAFNIADAVAILASLFGSPAIPLPAPYPGCGVDPTMDMLDCQMTACP